MRRKTKLIQKDVDRLKDPLDWLCLVLKQNPVQRNGDLLITQGGEVVACTPEFSPEVVKGASSALPWKHSVRVLTVSYNILPEMIQSIRMLSKALEETMPGVKHIACKDYAILNDAPRFASETMVKLRAGLHGRKIRKKK